MISLTTNKYFIAAILALALFVAGFYTGKGQKEIEIQEKVVQIKGETQVLIKDRIVTVTKVVRPDGTVEEITRTEDKDRKETSRSEEIAKEKSKVTRSIASQYSLGLKYWVPNSDILDVGRVRDINNYEVQVGRRLVGEVWLQGGYRFDKQVSIGLQLQF
jgi:hypothetical protein